MKLNLTSREKRILILFTVFLAIWGMDRYRRWWRPAITMESRHYLIYSTATEEQTRNALEKAEMLYAAYTKQLSFLTLRQDHSKLKLKLYRNRDEFKRCNPRSGWAEAFYSNSCCHQYIDADQPNPYHWMIHEATHQLNRKVAELSLSKWLDEGLADYFGCSRITNETMQLGAIDKNTYPVWWLPLLVLSGNIDQDIRDNNIISLSLILQDKQGPDMDKYFNTYYIHWWSLIHFCFHYNHGQYKSEFQRIIADGGSYKSFIDHIGPPERIQREWYQYLCDLRKGKEGYEHLE
jgi:hypothetical protein